MAILKYSGPLISSIMKTPSHLPSYKQHLNVYQHFLDCCFFIRKPSLTSRLYQNSLSDVFSNAKRGRTLYNGISKGNQK